MDPVARTKNKVQKENLWFFVLSVLEKNRRYGYELRSLIEKEFGFLSGNVTAYRVLYDLKANGHVKRIVEGNRNYYTITPKGKLALKHARAFFRQLSKG